ncbi:hypothetical protein Ddc_20241 [Ditylenchus destructor]|nr:hypothetical protein Ddc_20241 [Ditylenchus destructor]
MVCPSRDRDPRLAAHRRAALQNAADGGGAQHRDRHGDQRQRHDRPAAHRVDVADALVAAMRPKSCGSSTIGMKKSVVAISACSSLSRYTAASSAVSMPTSNSLGTGRALVPLRISDTRRARSCSHSRRHGTAR